MLATTPSNFVASAGKGCYIARVENAGNIIEFESIDPQDFQGQEVPDVAIDPEDKTLSICNIDSDFKVAYVTVYETRCFGGDSCLLESGSTTDNKGETNSCITFIVLCPPKMFAHLCYMETEDAMSVRIESDVQEWSKHPNYDDSHDQLLGFPFSNGPHLCTQGEDGFLTHFFSGNLHAIDFRCPTGTPLLAVGDGEVVEISDKNTLTGIAVSNLFEWNSIMLKLDNPDPLFIEYVHIQTSNVKKGDRVRLGDVIGTTGSVGFSPEPHLHFAAYRSDRPDAPTVRVRFDGSRDGAFLPKAGYHYDSHGIVVDR